ncbi:MAG: GAF domain-containing protein, partial [Thermoanaerobaculia bacterium]|nr:GAF domain-containing protein [Thermoanaerobaculia bacterium]
MSTAEEKRLEEYETLLEIGLDLASSLDPHQVLTTALEKAEEFCHAESSSIWELDDERNELFFRLVRGEGALAIETLRVPLGEGIVGSVAESGEAEIVQDVASDPRWTGEPQEGFETRSILTVPLIARGKVVGVLQLLNPTDRRGFEEEDLRRMELFAGPLAHALANARLYARQKEIFIDMVTALSEAIEKRDPYTGGHVRRVVLYSLLLGHEMGLGRERLEDLRLAATLHDIGKIGVPDRVLRKPGRLEGEEVELMQRHAADGAEIIERVRSLRHLLPGIRSHHERIDGGGYPDGLTGDELALIPRIIGVADTYDAMTTDRPYRKALSPEEAAAEIEEHAGTQFCPEVAGAFRRLYQRGYF